MDEYISLPIVCSMAELIPIWKYFGSSVFSRVIIDLQVKALNSGIQPSIFHTEAKRNRTSSEFGWNP